MRLKGEMTVKMSVLKFNYDILSHLRDKKLELMTLKFNLDFLFHNYDCEPTKLQSLHTRNTNTLK